MRTLNRSRRRRSLRRWLFAAAAIVLIAAVAIPLKVAYDCQRVLNAARAHVGVEDVKLQQSGRQLTPMLTVAGKCNKEADQAVSARWQ